MLSVHEHDGKNTGIKAALWHPEMFQKERRKDINHSWLYDKI